MTEDFSDFLDPNDFAIGAIYKGKTILGIFDQEYVELHGVDSLQPVFLSEASHGFALGDTLTIGALTYAVRSVQGDGTGLTTLVLEAMS